MITKESMNYHCSKIIITLVCLSFSLGVHSQDYKWFYTKEKQCREFEYARNYEAAVRICNEIIAHPIDPENSISRSISIKGDACFRLGHYYLHAHYLKYDLQKAISYLEMAANTGTYFYMPELYLMMIYNLGSYGVCDYEKSFYWLKRGAEKHSVMKYLLGEVYEYGYTNFITNNGAMNVFKTTSQILAFPNVTLNHQTAYTYFLDFYDSNSSYLNKDLGKEKVSWNTPPVSKNRVTELDVAKALEEGTYLTRNFGKAYEFYNDNLPSIDELDKALSSYSTPQIADALFRFSQLIRFGRGTLANKKRADLYLKYAALCGSKKAQATIDSKIVSVED